FKQSICPRMLGNIIYTICDHIYLYSMDGEYVRCITRPGPYYQWPLDYRVTPNEIITVTWETVTSFSPEGIKNFKFPNVQGFGSVELEDDVVYLHSTQDSTPR